MNLLDIMLANEIHWPEGAKLAVQDDTGRLKWSLHNTTPNYHASMRYWDRKEGGCDPEYGYIEIADDQETRIVLKEEYQEAGGWLEWAGGDCPVNENQKVAYKMRSADQDTAIGGNLRWNHDLHGTGVESLGDIIAYRLHLNQEKQQNPEATITAEASEDTKDAVPEVVTQTLEEKLKAILDIRTEINNTKAELQKQEVNLKTLIAEVNNQMQTYGFTLEDYKPLVITDWRDLQKGDVIIARGEEWKAGNINRELVIEGKEHKDYRGSYRIKANNDWGKDFEFVSRPNKK